MTGSPASVERDDAAQRLLFVSAAILGIVLCVRLDPAHRPAPEGWEPLPARLAGLDAPRFGLVTLAGDTVLLPRIGRATLLIAHSPRCTYCERSIPAWRGVAQSECHADVVAVSADPVEELAAYWAERSLAGCANVFAGSALDSRSFAESYSVSGTPLHYLTDPGGTPRRAWVGIAEG
jgi:hypothetical protein